MNKDFKKPGHSLREPSKNINLLLIMFAVRLSFLECDSVQRLNPVTYIPLHM